MNLAYLSRRSTKKLQEIRKWECFITNIKEFTQRTQNVRFHSPKGIPSGECLRQKIRKELNDNYLYFG